MTPATYDNEGRGNCNLGAIKLDTKGETVFRTISKCT
jgi:hypothetical protein